MQFRPDHDDDPRPDAERAADAALGRSVAHAAAERLAEGHDPRGGGGLPQFPRKSGV